MTRFARPSKKTSLEATPWHQLVNFGGANGSKQGSKTGEENHDLAGKKTRVARKKRKNFEIDIGSVKSKKAKASEHDKNKIKHVQDGSDSPTRSKKKNWEQALKLKKSSHKIMKKKKLQGSYKNSEKNKKASHINTCRTEALDKKREARKKRRAKGKACFHCRQTGHLVSECPLAQDTEMGVGNCYKCGSSEHTTKSCNNKSNDTGGFPFAKCFICGETGHIARSCPDNPKGLYPNGGGCKICGSVEHFRRDCPNLVQESKGSTTTSHVHNMKNIKGHYSADAEIEHDTGTTQKTPKKKGPKTVKF